ncbi:PTS glucose-like transporter subunit IIB [Haloplasma contractile]|uniref:PTS system glucose-specific IIB component protein n=1 Tax=Haloplasma contractile SSD-17B TaxID=1033810 RepID=U2E8S2_9MOLU|nr:PTS glucose-like transporter subunit IIB [Haloplasma contractile]ERJ11538.1 PTS system glucose-specific IIB component protein [Haloplasma contractile SSD-17B]
MKEKKVYNRKVLVIASLAYLIPFIVQFFYNIEIEFIMELTEEIRDIIGIGIYLITMIPLLSVVARKSFNKFIKRDRESNIKSGLNSLLIVSFLGAFIQYLLDVNAYVYVIAIVFSIVFYSFVLVYLDKKYEKASLNKKMSINDEKVAQFMNALGGKDNVVDVSYELRRVKIELVDVEQINPDEIKELGATGMFISGNKLQAIIGENAEELDELLKKYLSK